MPRINRPIPPNASQMDDRGMWVILRYCVGFAAKSSS
jgi:hypothetical protein